MIEKNKLKELYINKKLPMTKIAEILNKDRGTISSWLDKYNIKKRSRSEVTKIVWGNMTAKEKERQVQKAHAKNKELAKKGELSFQRIWKEKPGKMRAQVRKNALKACKKRKKNGMKGVTGPDHPNWNPDLTKEDREKKRRCIEKTNWRQKVFKRDNYTCQICEENTSGNLNAHHKYSYTDYPDKRTDISNGVTLCKSCHKEFHMQYGWGNNTVKQFEEFKKTKQSKKQVY